MPATHTKSPDIIKDELLFAEKEKRVFATGRHPLLFGIYYFDEFFDYPIAPYMKDFCQDMIDLADHDSKHCTKMLNQAAWIAFRESAKTTWAKIFAIWCAAHEKRNYINWDSYDKGNAEQALYDIAVMLQTNERLIEDYGQLFWEDSNKDVKKSKKKSISEFITSNGVKFEAFSTGTSSRGRVYKKNRPDLFIFDDIETNKTKKSPTIQQGIIDHIDETIGGLAGYGSILYLGNLITLDGVIEYVMDKLKDSPKGRVRDIPVINDKGEIAWPSKYVKTDEEAAEINKKIENKRKKKVSIETKRRDIDNFEGEMMNNPTTSEDLVFDQDAIKYQLEKHAREPVREIGKFKIFKEYKQGQRHGIGADPAEGTGNDHSASCTINFSTEPKAMVASFKSNLIDQVRFGKELIMEGNTYGQCMIAPERQAGYSTIVHLVENYGGAIYRDERKDKAQSKTTGRATKKFGWRATGGKIEDAVFDLAEAVEEGDLIIFDRELLKEMQKFTYADLYESARRTKAANTTRHFDKLRAAAIAWQLRAFAENTGKKGEHYKQPDHQPRSDYYGS